MALEFLITGLTGVFLWLFLRHLLAFRKEKILKQAGDLLLEVKTTKTGYFLRLAGRIWAILPIFIMLFLPVYFFLQIKKDLKGFFPDSPPIPGYYFVFIEWTLCFIVFLVLLILPVFIQRGRISFTIHRRGIVHRIGPLSRIIPWEMISYGIWSSTKKRISFQPQSRWLRNRFFVKNHETVSPILGQFIALRSHRGHILSSPGPAESPETSADADKSPNSSCHGRIEKKRPLRLFHFQFDLLTLLLFMLVVASASSWHACRNHRAGPQAEAVRKLAHLQPKIFFDDVNVKDVRFLIPPHDEDLSVLKSFPDLEHLSIFGAPITDAGVKNLETLTQLRVLYLHSTKKITDEGLNYLMPLRRLQTLALWNVNLTDRGLHRLKSLIQLETLIIAGNGITDAGVKELTSLKNLRQLSIDGQITDAGVKELMSLKNLRELSLHGQITDAGMLALKNMKSLQKVWIASPLTSLKAYQELHKALPQAEVRLPDPPNPSPPPPLPAADDAGNKSL